MMVVDKLGWGVISNMRPHKWSISHTLCVMEGVPFLSLPPACRNMDSMGLGFHPTHTFALMGRILIWGSVCMYVCMFV